MDQRSFENRNTKWEAEGSGSHSSSARAHSCGHMACAHVKHKWEPAGAPSPPSHSEREPSKLKQHSVTNRNVNSRCVEVLGFWIMFSPFLCMPVVGGVTWVFLYPKAKKYICNKSVIVLQKRKKKTHHNDHFSFFDRCSNELVLLHPPRSLKGMVHTGNNKSSYLEKPLIFPITGEVHKPIDTEPSSSTKNRANHT